MFFIVAGAVIGFFKALTSFRRECGGEKGKTVFHFCAFIILFTVLGCFIMWAFTGVFPTRYQLSKEIELTSLKNGGMDTGGIFVLGCGTIESKPCYLYYTAVGRNIYQMKSVEITDQAFVYEEDRTNGVLEIYTKIPDGYARWFTFKDFIGGGDRYEFHIPKGSIAQIFSL